jgi:DNA-binding GntR family transcriptional regulator
MRGKKKPLRQSIHDHLIADIISGQINAGEKLLEEDLAKKFRVSRTPIREAIVQLEKEGYVIHKKDIGAVVKKVSLQEIRETFEVIALLEAYAVEVVAQAKLGLADRSRMLLLIEGMEEQIKEQKYAEYMRDNIQFHRFFNERCGNETMFHVVTDLRRKVHRLIFAGLTVPKYVDFFLVSHRKICDAIQRGDPVAAGVAMRAHVEEHKNYILEEMSVMYRIGKKMAKQ